MHLLRVARGLEYAEVYNVHVHVHLYTHVASGFGIIMCNMACVRECNMFCVYSQYFGGQFQVTLPVSLIQVSGMNLNMYNIFSKVSTLLTCQCICTWKGKDAGVCTQCACLPWTLSNPNTLQLGNRRCCPD